jgi:hypothetical protein
MNSSLDNVAKISLIFMIEEDYTISTEGRNKINAFGKGGFTYGQD